MNTKYRAYKARLRIEFLHRCAYCETREPEIGGSKSFHIDHYKPKKKFPDLINAYNNLIYACQNCNGYKSDYWPSYIEKNLGRIILNPRKDQIATHIDTSSFAWTGITPSGKWTVKKLRLDSTALSQRREDRFRIENKIQQLSAIVENAKLEIARQNRSPTEYQELEKFIAEETKNIETFKRKITGPMD